MTSGSMGNRRGSPTRENTHIPYRDSKLTHMLKPCFNNGNSMTHLIICLAPTHAQLQEAISSMKFAQNAKSIKQNQEEAAMLTKAVRLVGEGLVKP